MSEKQPLPPDFLRRFTPTPYLFELQLDRTPIRIEADDLEVALAIRDICQGLQIEKGVPVRFWRMIRDRQTVGYGTDVEIFATGELRSMMHRSGSVLIADRVKAEVFGFIAMGLTMHELTGRLLPLLLSSNETTPRDSAFYKQVTNGILRSDNSQVVGRYLGDAAEDYVKYSQSKI
jgi:hypothetical protein